MRILLAGILTLFPLTIHAEFPDDSLTDRLDPPVFTDSAAVWNEVDPGSAMQEVAPYGNPYAPASPTNFESFIGPHLLIQGHERILPYDRHAPNIFDVNPGGVGPR